MSTHIASHGRGGAGNMASSAQSPKLTPADLTTPTLKTAVVTTGRGGTGNMAKNQDAYETRLRQDVDPVPRRLSSGAQHAGRGGAGNVFKDNETASDLLRKPSNENAVSDDGSASASNNNKAKGWFFGKKA